MALIIDEVKNFPQTCLKTKSGADIWVVAKGYPKILKWRINDAFGVLTGRYEAFRFLTQDDMAGYENTKGMKQKEEGK